MSCMGGGMTVCGLHGSGSAQEGIAGVHMPEDGIALPGVGPFQSHGMGGANSSTSACTIGGQVRTCSIRTRSLIIARTFLPHVHSLQSAASSRHLHDLPVVSHGACR